MRTNRQKPFAFEGRYRRNRYKLDVDFPSYLSKNIAGICMTCGHQVQKVRKFDKDGVKLLQPNCMRCLVNGYNNVVIEFPLELRPWKVNNIKTQFTTGHLRFLCEKCKLKMFSWAFLGALCGHKTHQPPKHFVCRLCCTKIIEQKEEEQPATGISLEDRFQYYERLGANIANIYGEMLAPAPAPTHNQILNVGGFPIAQYQHYDLDEPDFADDYEVDEDMA